MERDNVDIALDWDEPMARRNGLQPQQLQQQQVPPATPGWPGAGPISIEVVLCVPEDQKRHLPARLRAPPQLPASVPVPRQGEVVYLTPRSAWGVQLVVHEWQAFDTLRIEVWLDHVGSSRFGRPSGFALTQ